MAANAIGIDRSATLTTATEEVGTMMIVQNNSAIGVSGLLTSQELALYTALESNDYNWVLDNSVQYGETIRCLIQYESSHNPNATGDKGKAFGILQFWRTTFNQYSQKYELDLSYENPVHQIILADKMLQDDYREITHWSPWRKCYGR